MLSRLTRRLSQSKSPIGLPRAPLTFHSQRCIDITTLNTPEESLQAVRERSPHQAEFLQAVTEVVESLHPLFKIYPQYAMALPVLCEPERMVQFRVPWVDDNGNTHVNRGMRCQFNQSLGPYKGGLVEYFLLGSV